MTTPSHDAALSLAADALDRLLGDDDNQILAAIALYRSTLTELFGRAELVQMLADAVEQAPNVSFFSRRSRREIDPGRPELNLVVDDAAALVAHPELASQLRDLSVNAPLSPTDMNRLVAFKSGVIFQEVCRPLGEKMRSLLEPHWEKSRVQLSAQGIAPEHVSLVISNLFSVRVSTETPTKNAQRMCILSMFV